MFAARFMSPSDKSTLSVFILRVKDMADTFEFLQSLFSIVITTT